MESSGWVMYEMVWFGGKGCRELYHPMRRAPRVPPLGAGGGCWMGGLGVPPAFPGTIVLGPSFSEPPNFITENVAFNKPIGACLDWWGPTLKISPNPLGEGGWARDIARRRTSTSFSSVSGKGIYFTRGALRRLGNISK